MFCLPKLNSWATLEEVPWTNNCIENLIPSVSNILFYNTYARFAVYTIKFSVKLQLYEICKIIKIPFIL